MFSVLAFVLTFGQLALIFGSYALQAKMVFYLLTVYGSPFYLAMHLFNAQSVLADNSALYIAVAIYHILKYLVMFKAQRDGDRPGLFFTAAAFEAFYLCLSGYYIN